MIEKCEKWIEFTAHGAGIALCLRGEHGAVRFKLLGILAKASRINSSRRTEPRFALARWRFQRNWGSELESTRRLVSVSSPAKLDPIDTDVHHCPQPVDLGYHSYTPLHNYQENPTTDFCPVLHGRPCHYDGSALGAEQVLEVLLREGNEGVWRELEECYQQTFQHLEERTCDIV